MECSVIRDWLIDYRENELHGRRKAAVEGHLKLCAGCRAELGALEDLVAAIAQIPTVDPWPGFFRRLQVRLDRDASSPSRGWRRGAAGKSAWIAGGVLLLVAGAVVHWFFLASGWLYLSNQRPPNGDAARTDVSKRVPGESEFKQRSGLWERAGWSMDDFEDGPDGMLTGMVLGNMEAAPEEVITLWKRDIAGANSLDQLMDIPAASDAQIEKVLDQVRR